MMKRIKSIMLTIVLLGIGITASSQVYTGGNMSINYANGIYADVSPIIGYRIKKLKVGLSPFYSYSQAKGFSGEYTYGGRVFSEFDIIKGIFAHAEFGMVNYPNVSTSESSDRVWRMALPLGVGYEQVVSKKVRIHAMILYDVLLDKNSTQDNPTVRAGATYDF